MGVLGFVSFLQRTCPQTIRTLPNRLQELGGRILVFDGTLITQRLHFSPTPHRYRHVLGWYRMIKELKECNVQAICVFDGNQRSFAKKRETERRRQLRRVDAARGSIESDRLCRLRKLTSLLRASQGLQGPKRERATQALRDLVAKVDELPAIFPIVVDSTSFFGEVSDNDPWGGMCDLDIQEVLFQSSVFLQTVTALPMQNLRDMSPGDDTVHLRCPPGPYELDQDCYQQVHYVDEIEAAEAVPFNPDEISTALASLYVNYRNSIPQLASLPVSFTTKLEDDPTTAYAMSKLQHKLVLDEGRIWEDIDQLMKAGADQETTQSPLQVLEEKSASMLQSYERRNNPPTAETYTESKSILRAMGVPCVESTGPYEAEAVASSIVLHGYADYVVSEDSDVLVYEAPLLRNITSRRDPLIIISGSEVRTVLSLERADYLDFVLLLGTDFSQRIKNVGPQRALKFIREHGSIERIIEQETKYPPRVPLQDYLEQIVAARLVFQTLPPLPDLESLEQKEVDDTLVSDLLQRFRLHKLVANDSDYMSSIMGSNYFGDNP